MNSGLVGVILAGGRGNRMGGADKALLDVAGRPILAHVLALLRPALKTIIINANGDSARFRSFGLPVVADASFDQGPLAGILAGMQWAAGATEAHAIITVAGDTPFFPRDLVARLAASATEHPGCIVLARSGGRVHPVFGLWPLALRADLARHLDGGGSRKVADWAETQPLVLVDFPATGDADPFFNVNTPADLAHAETLARAGGL